MLILVPTPIGNLFDITFRGLEALALADIIICEDTRMAKKLLSLLQERFCIQRIFDTPQKSSSQENLSRNPSQNLSSKILSLNPANKQFFSFHSHNQDEFIAKLDPCIFDKNVIYLSDAGMPSICDPGALLVQYAQAHNIAYEVLPGCCAFVLGFAFSGVESQDFVFGGFLPPKQNNRQKKLLELLRYGLPVIVYESPHRILDSLKDMVQVCNDASIFAIKEITKLHQSFVIGSPQDVLSKLQKSNIQGEWVIVICATPKRQLCLCYDEILALPLPPKLKSKLLAQISDKEAKQIYKELIAQ